jgi:NADPH:quinone reductase-like Zn-dependent oxidoreductase/NAD(P)-dependent dehydrogenase (short-subunit alcohol dehydrogenase family)
VRWRAAGGAEGKIQPDATYLVTGGLSGLGLLTARRLVERGARALALVGRRGRTAEAEPALGWIEAQGVRLLVAAADVAREADVARVLGEVRATLPPLRGVIHCAGTLVDRAVERQTWDSFQQVLAPKVGGAWNLHVQTRADPLDFFVLFSSNSAIVGLAGQANYAAANAFLDALAHHRHAAGLPALSIAWGPWSDVGMAARSGMARERLVIDPDGGLHVLDGLLDAGAAPQVIVPTTTAAKPAAAKPAARARGAGRPSQVDPAQLGGLLRVEWADRSGASPPQRPERWAVLGAQDLVVAPPEVQVERHADVAALRAALDRGAALPDAVVLPCASPPGPPGVPGADRITAARDAIAHALAQLQAWLADPRFAPVRFVVVTRGAVAVHPGEDVPDLVHAPLWGAIPAVQRAHPDRSIALLDTDASRAVALPVFDPPETELALRSGVCLVPRLVPAGPRDALVPPEAPAWRLDIAAKGALDRLALVADPAATAPLGAGQVRVAVHAAGLNFRDVLDALGMYPGTPPPLGGEGAGVVLEVGAGVTALAPGDRVMGQLRAAFGPIAVTDQRLVVRMPDGWSFADAAATPIVFLTAYYALVDLARLQPGERVLIHAAAGGVGMAATQIARHLGAEVFATASPGKWGTLRALGFDADHLASSRTPAFEGEFLRATGGRGVDVVLDSLARELVDASLRLLPRGGRFLEMGKTDVRDPDEVARRHAGVVYRAFDLGEAGPDRIQHMLGALIALFQRGALRPLPVTAHDLRHAPRAFRVLAQGHHVGKRVLTVPRPLDPQGTVLITPGTGALGALLARHLVRRHRIAHLVLASPRGPAAPGAEAVQRELEAAGARVTVVGCDPADRAALSALLAAIPREHPLTAAVHAPDALDDGALAAAVHLDELTRAREPALVLVSALAGAGQVHPAAAGAFFDALAHHRRARGRATWALALAHGEAGGPPPGVHALASDEALARFDAALAHPDAAFVAARFDAAALRARVVPPRLRALELAPAPVAQPAAEPAAAAASFQHHLAALPAAERERAVLDLVRARVGAVLGLAAHAAVPPDRPLQDLGLDSLMAIELRNQLGAAIGGKRLSSTAILIHPTVAALAQHIARDVLGLATPAPGEAPPAPIAPVSAGNGAAGNGAAHPAAGAPAEPPPPAALSGSAGNVVMLSGSAAKVPFTLIHGIGGYAWAYRPLRPFLGDRPMVLVNRVSLGQGLGDYVALLVEALRTRQPRGPYILGGWSAGGRLALEITAALERMGEQVLGLFLFDVYRQTPVRRLRLAASRLMLRSAVGQAAVADMHPIERLLTVFGMGMDVASVDDVVRLTRRVLPDARVPGEAARWGLAEAARWFLDQLAHRGGQGLMLPDPTGAATEALEMLFTIRHIYRMTMGEIRIPAKIAAPGFLINVAGNADSLGWQRHFASPLRRYDVGMPPAKRPPRWATPFSRFAEHIALFAPDNVPRFGPQVAALLAMIDGARPGGDPRIAPPRPEGDRTARAAPSVEAGLST